MPFIAIINSPGYMPEAEPVEFDTAHEAWEYLASERREAEGWNPDDVVTQDLASETLESLHKNVLWAASGLVCDFEAVGTITGPTPGYDGDHDLGLAYTVDYVEPEPTADEVVEDYIRNWPISQARDLTRPPMPPVGYPLARAAWDEWSALHAELWNGRTRSAVTLNTWEQEKHLG